ncbi:MAG: hypothetical protein COV48_00355, partial [Elusimicrobia bacterium CG11_big_fil_rev_8_21_14_0_20_64_6]
MINLYKYSLRPQLDPLSPYKIDARIKFVLERVRGGTSQFEKAVFLTNDRMGSTDAASRFLSITYRPIYEYRATSRAGCTLVLNDGRPYRAEDNPTRVWPAFGKHGGGRELLLTQGRAPVKLIRRFDNAGQFDPFRQDGVMAGEIAAVPTPVAALLARFAENVQTALAKHIDQQTNDDPYRLFAVKVQAGVGAVVAWSRRESGWLYSVSCACHNENAANEPRSLCAPFPEFSMWGSIWHDDEDSRTRLFDYPLYERFIVPVFVGP